MINHNLYFYLHSWCIPVKGQVRATICDFHRQDVSLIPLELADILNEYNGKTIGEVMSDFDVEDHEVLEEYFDFMIEEEYILTLLQPDPTLLFELNTEYSVPSPILSAIVDLDKTSTYNAKKAIEELSFLRCQSLQIRCYDVFPFYIIEGLMEATNNTTFRSVELIVHFETELIASQIIELKRHFMRIDQVHFHGVPQSSNLDFFQNQNVTWQHDQITSCESCGLISKATFSINQSSYLLQKNFNSCLYKKVGIDVNGNIKNCPSAAKSYGKINEVPLQTVVAHPDFARLGSIQKDQIKVCSGCEFRYICTDCRIYTEDAEDPLSKPAKCAYNPETAIWETEETLTQPT